MNQINWDALGKFLAGGILLAVWGYIRVAHVQGADDIVSFCQAGLVGLASHYLTTFGSVAGQAPAIPPGSTTIISTKGE